MCIIGGKIGAAPVRRETRRPGKDENASMPEKRSVRPVAGVLSAALSAVERAVKSKKGE